MNDLSTLPADIRVVLYTCLCLASLCIGSFLNVVIHRLPRRQSVVKPRSRCPKCKKMIPWYQNIPVLSWLLLRARCASCGKRISFRYPLVELLTASLLMAAVFSDPRWPAWPFDFYLLGALVACTFIDLDHWILPDKITLPGVVIGFASSFFTGLGIVMSLVGAALGFGLLYGVAWGYRAIAKRDGLGGGDIKFLAMVGAFLGPQGVLATLMLGSFLGSFLGLFLILFRGRRGTTAIPFGPFLALGAAAAFFFGEPMWRWYFGIH